MNDSVEFTWGRELFLKVLKENKSGFEQQFRIFIIGIVTSAVPNTLPLIACFSLKGDLLSQWRAYADDGRGLSVGFNSKEIFHGLGVNMNSVVYDEEKQYSIILNTLRGLHAIWMNSNKDFDEIVEPSMIFSVDLAYIKNPSFFEEQEVRIIRLLSRNGENFIDVGGNSETNVITPLNVLTRKRDENEISYVKLPAKIGNRHIIKEVIIGPKNKTSASEIQEVLERFGVKDVIVKKSNSTYR